MTTSQTLRNGPTPPCCQEPANLQIIERRPAPDARTGRETGAEFVVRRCRVCERLHRTLYAGPALAGLGRSS